MALPPGKVEFTRPARKKPRLYTEKDLKRIAGLVVESGVSPVKVLAGIAVGLGLGWLFCVAARTIDNTLTIKRFLLKLGGILAIAKITDFLLTVVTSGAFKKLVVVTRIAAVVIVLVAVLESLARALAGMVEDASMMEEASGLVHDLCSTARDIAAAASEEIGAKYNDVKDIID